MRRRALLRDHSRVDTVRRHGGERVGFACSLPMADPTAYHVRDLGKVLLQVQSDLQNIRNVMHDGTSEVRRPASFPDSPLL